MLVYILLYNTCYNINILLMVSQCDWWWLDYKFYVCFNPFNSRPSLSLSLINASSGMWRRSFIAGSGSALTLHLNDRTLSGLAIGEPRLALVGKNCCKQSLVGRPGGSDDTAVTAQHHHNLTTPQSTSEPQWATVSQWTTLLLSGLGINTRWEV